MMRRRFFNYRTYRGNPFGLALRGNGNLYVGEVGAYMITIVNKLDNGVVNVIMTTAGDTYIFDIKIDEAGGHYYYCAVTQNSIIKMTLDTNTFVETKSFATNLTVGFDIDYAGNRLFVCNQGGANIFVHDFTTNALIATIISPPDSERIIYDSARNRLIVCYLDGYIRTFDATTYALDETIAVSVGNYLRGMVADYVNNQLFISNTTLTEIYVYNLDLLTYRNELYQTTGEVFGMAVDNTSNLLFYGDDGVIKNIPIIPQTNTVIIFLAESNSGGVAFNSNAMPAELGARNLNLWKNITNDGFYKCNIGTQSAGGNNVLGHAGLDPDSGWHGWELELSNQVDSGIFNSDKTYLVKCGQGGSTISQWATGQSYYNTAISRIDGALAAIAAIDSNPTDIFIMYTQGINDAIAGTNADTWYNGTVDLLDRLKARYAAIKHIYATNIMLTNANYIAINDKINLLDANRADFTAIPVNASYDYDTNHWGYTEMKRMAGVMLNLIKTYV